MPSLNKYLLCLALPGLLLSCRKGEKPIEPADRGNVITAQVDMSSDYRDQIWFSLSGNSVISTNLKTAWDISCESDAAGYHIRLNTAKSMSARRTSETDFASVMDTIGYSLYKAYDMPGGSPDSTAIGDWRNHGYVYVIDRGFSNTGATLGMKKMKILASDAASYTIAYADVSGANSHTITVIKDAPVNQTYVSFDSNASLSIEPPKDSYDLLFSQYTHIYTNPFMPYLVSGVLINPWQVRVAAVHDISFKDIKASDTLSHPFSTMSNAIGYDWKTYSLQTSVYTTDASKCYIIRDVKGYLYKLHFIDFYSSTGIKGAPKFEFKKL